MRRVSAAFYALKESQSLIGTFRIPQNRKAGDQKSFIIAPSPKPEQVLV